MSLRVYSTNLTGQLFHTRAPVSGYKQEEVYYTLGNKFKPTHTCDISSACPTVMWQVFLKFHFNDDSQSVSIDVSAS